LQEEAIKEQTRAIKAEEEKQLEINPMQTPAPALQAIIAVAIVLIVVAVTKLA
jgi:hypothetical protein